MNSKQKTEMGNPKKDGTFKQAARWVAKMFGYKAENKFAQGVWYVFATSVAALTLAINNYKYHRKDHDPTYLHDFSNQYVSPYIIYHDWYPSYLYNLKTGHRTLTDVHWICKSSDGDSLACVYEKGMLHLIDHDGKKVMDKEFPYGIRNNDYCFHNGLCIMYDENGRFGLIDKQGKWSVEPQYYEIEYDTKGFWLVQDRDWN